MYKITRTKIRSLSYSIFQELVLLIDFYRKTEAHRNVPTGYKVCVYVVFLPYVNSMLTVKMATTLFLCEKDTVSRDTVTRLFIRTQIHQFTMPQLIISGSNFCLEMRNSRVTTYR